MLHKTQKASPPHEMRKSNAAPPRCSFAFRGLWGDFIPPTKKHSPKLAWGLLYYGYTHCDILCDNVVTGGVHLRQHFVFFCDLRST